MREEEETEGQGVNPQPGACRVCVLSQSNEIASREVGAELSGTGRGHLVHRRDGRSRAGLYPSA